MAKFERHVNWEELKEYFLRSSIVKEVRNLLEDINKEKITRADAENYLLQLIKALESGYKTTNLWIIKNKIIPEIEKRNLARAKVLEFLVNKIKEHPDKFGFEDKEIIPTTEENVEIEKSSEVISGVIGRVAIVKSNPASPYSFAFWLERNPDTILEPGDFIAVELFDNHKAVAVVEDIQSISDINSTLDHHYLWAFGAPQQEMPTEVPIVRTGTARIVYRSDNRNTPFCSFHPIIKAKSNILSQVFSEFVREQERILLGFVKDGEGVFVPVFGDFSYLFGYEGGHINISGKSGVAGKTSYALFFIASSLSAIKKTDRKLAFVAFNVKERDLLDIGNIPFKNLNEAIEEMRKKAESENKPELRKSADIWEKALEFGINPIEVFKEATIYKPSPLFSGEPLPSEIQYSYGLQDVLERGIYTFLSLFEKEDVDDKFESLAYSIREEFLDGRTSFNRLISELQSRVSSATSGGRAVRIGGIEHFPQTVLKMITRLNKILLSAKVLERDRPRGAPIPTYKLRSEDLWIIDIRPLRDNEQRMVFYSILSDLNFFLERKKYGETRPELEESDVIDISFFPDRVCVFIDELNKFAPSGGRISSPIKQFIVDIASRGRSIGLTLLGAEQFASHIDEEVLGNMSTYLIGKSEEFELSYQFYKRLPEGFKKRIPHLRKGELILVHEVLTTPLVISFPIPLHRI